jgi:ribosome-binding factor A
MAKSYPRSRVMGETVREVVARILVEEISDPRIALVTVTGVDVSPDLRYATVFVATHGDDAHTSAALAGLDSAKGRIRTLLSSRVTTRFVPELQFRLDPAIEEAARIAEAIRRERETGRVSEDVIGAGEGSDENV